jgi:hypothetical protein
MAGIPRHQGRAEPKLGPSDLSDTSADRPGAENTDTDAAGTGESITVGRAPKSEQHDEASVDRVVREDEAGLGKGLDEAEKARLDPVSKAKR